jgi:hypothetical protein
MIVYPEAKKTYEQKEKIVDQADQPSTPTVGEFNKKIYIDVSGLSKEEIAEYGSQKTNFMYSKYGSIRIFSALLFMGLIAGVVMYKQKHMLKSIKGSILESEVKHIVSRNPKINSLLKSRGKGDLEYDHLVGGGIANNEFKCVLYINNLTNGRL